MIITIGHICGSLRNESYNRIIAKALEDLDDSIEFHWIELENIPLFNQDLEVGGDAETVISFKTLIQEVDGIIIVSPEYNSGILRV